MLVSTNIYPVSKLLFDTPLSDFAFIIACCSGSTKELHNNSYVLDCLSYYTLVLLAGIDPNFQVQFLSLPDILLHNTAYFWWASAGVLQSFPGWEKIPCVQQ